LHQIQQYCIQLADSMQLLCLVQE